MRVCCCARAAAPLKPRGRHGHNLNSIPPPTPETTQRPSFPPPKKKTKTQIYNQDRPPFDLKKPLAAWNLFLALFSWAGVFRTVPYVLYWCVRAALRLLNELRLRLRYAVVFLLVVVAVR